MSQRIPFLLGLATLLFVPMLGAAQAPAPTTFARTVSYESCTETWAFACGMRDSSGRTFGTAHPVRHCSRWELQPNGSVTLSIMGGVVSSQGRYRIDGRTVHVEWLDEAGAVRNRQTFQLSPDGSELGGMNRLAPEPTTN